MRSARIEALDWHLENRCTVALTSEAPVTHAAGSPLPQAGPKP